MIQSASRRTLLLHLCAPVVLVGCASASGGRIPASEQQALIERVRAYWKHVAANNRMETWKYEVASQDQTLTLEAYVKRGGLVYDAVEVRAITRMEGDQADLEVWMRYSVPLARIKRKEVVMRDRWRRINGEWFHELALNPLANVTM